jgi:hypothetical protein
MVGYDEELLADRSTANRPAEDAPATAMGPGGGDFVGVYARTPTSIRDGGRRAVIRSCDARKVRFSATPGRQPEVGSGTGIAKLYTPRRRRQPLHHIVPGLV